MDKKLITNKELLKITETSMLSDMVGERRLRWAGHVRRMGENRVPKKILFGEIQCGRVRRGKPRRTWIKSMENDCSQRNIRNWVNKPIA